MEKWVELGTKNKQTTKMGTTITHQAFSFIKIYAMEKLELKCSLL